MTKTIKALQTEINKLRELKEKGQFNLQQAENALQRLANNFLEKLSSIKEEIDSMDIGLDRRKDRIKIFIEDWE